MATAAKIGIGSAINRVDGVEKVTGTARYAAEHPVENLLYGYIVEAAIAKGRIVSIDEEAARAVPGVVEIITHLNRPHVAWTDHSYKDELKIPGSPFRPLYDDRIHFSQQPIALVMAETFVALSTARTRSSCAPSGAQGRVAVLVVVPVAARSTNAPARVA